MTRSRSNRTVFAIAVVVTAAVAIAIPAWAFWSVGSTNVTGQTKAATLVAPTAASASATSSSAITISYTPATQPATVDYRVIRTSGPGSPFTVCTVPATTTSCNDTGLTPLTAYGYTVAAVIPSTNWVGPTASASATTSAAVATRTFTVTPSVTTVNAGTALNLVVQAQLNGVNDPTYTGTKSITFSGPASSPNGTAPLYAGTATTTKNITFDVLGKATVVTTLFKAAAAPGTTVTVTDGTLTGTSAGIVVNALAPSALCWVDATSCDGAVYAVATSTTKSFTAGLVDLYHNTAKATSVITVTIGPKSGSAGSVVASTQTIAIGSSQVATATSMTSASTTSKKTTAQATAPGLTTANVILDT